MVLATPEERAAEKRRRRGLLISHQLKDGGGSHTGGKGLKDLLRESQRNSFSDTPAVYFEGTEAGNNQDQEHELTVDGYTSLRDVYASNTTPSKRQTQRELMAKHIDQSIAERYATPRSNDLWSSRASTTEASDRLESVPPSIGPTGTTDSLPSLRVADKLLVTAGAVGFQVKAFVANVDRKTSVDDVGDVGCGSNLSSNKALSSSNISNSVSTIGNNISTVGIEAVSTGVDGVMVKPVKSSNSLSTSISNSTSEQPRLNASNWGSEVPTESLYTKLESVIQEAYAYEPPPSEELERTWRLYSWVHCKDAR